MEGAFIEASVQATCITGFGYVITNQRRRGSFPFGLHWAPLATDDRARRSGLIGSQGGYAVNS